MRVSAITCAVAGEMLEGVVDRFKAFVVSHAVRVIENEHELVPGRPDAVQELSDELASDAAAPSRPRVARPTPGSTRSTAVAT